jgi:hypothetical protein
VLTDDDHRVQTMGFGPQLAARLRRELDHGPSLSRRL